MKQSVQAAVCSHIGNMRENNEDNFFLNGVYMTIDEMDKGGLFTGASKALRQVYAVCDWMGGEANGELASSTVVSVLTELNFGIPAREGIDRIVGKANDLVYNLHKKAGSTLALLYLHEGKATVAWLGDSRIYLLRENKLQLLSEDHTQAQRLVNMGVLDAESAKSHAMRHALTRYLGMQMDEAEFNPSYGKELILCKGDTFLLCSDGLTEMIRDDLFKSYLSAPPKQAVTTMINEALSAGGRDNITVMVVKIEECKRMWSKLF